jgi:hypothetical protein
VSPQAAAWALRPITFNAQRAAIEYLRCTTSGAAGNVLGTTIKFLHATAGIGLHTMIKFLRAAASMGLGTTAKYLWRSRSGAAGNCLCTTAKYLVNQNAGAGNNWAKAHIQKAGYEFR